MEASDSGSGPGVKASSGPGIGLGGPMAGSGTQHSVEVTDSRRSHLGKAVEHGLGEVSNTGPGKPMISKGPGQKPERATVLVPSRTVRQEVPRQSPGLTEEVAASSASAA